MVFVTLMAVFNFQITPFSTAATKREGSCGVTIGDAHYSTDMMRDGVRAVKINVYSKCTQSLRSVTVYVELYKEGMFGPHLVRKTSKFYTFVKPGEKAWNKNTFDYCKNFTKTWYYGVAHSVALINGQRSVVPQVWSSKPIQLDCGT